MKVLKLFALGICFVLGACSNQSTSIVQTNEHGTQWSWDKGTIVVKTPERPAGQTSAIGLTVPKMEVVRVGFVGLGMRGPGAVERFTYIPGVQIVALCDYEQERAEKCQKFLQKASMPKAAVYSGEKGYEQLCKRMMAGDVTALERTVPPKEKPETKSQAGPCPEKQEKKSGSSRQQIKKHRMERLIQMNTRTGF